MRHLCAATLAAFISVSSGFVHHQFVVPPSSYSDVRTAGHARCSIAGHSGTPRRSRGILEPVSASPNAEGAVAAPGVEEVSSATGSDNIVGDGTPAAGGMRRVYEYWKWRGYNINFRVEGPEEAPPVILIHGFGASVGHFRKNIPVLVAEGYKVYAIDLLGFGASDKPTDVKYELELWRDLVCDFMEAKSRTPSEQWVVMGNSIGGLLTLMVTERFQDDSKIRGSVLFNTAGGMVSFRESELPFYLLPVMWFFNNVVFGPTFGPMFFSNFRTESNVRSVLKQVYTKDVVDDDLVNMLIAPSDDQGACDVFLKVFTGPAGPSPGSVLQKIKDTKVLALWGETDPWTPLDRGPHSGASLGKYLDTFELVVLPQTGHCPQDESPDQCHEVLLPWLKTLP